MQPKYIIIGSLLLMIIGLLLTFQFQKKANALPNSYTECLQHPYNTHNKATCSIFFKDASTVVAKQCLNLGGCNPSDADLNLGSPGGCELVFFNETFQFPKIIKNA